jgi:hypothetical protein
MLHLLMKTLTIPVPNAFLESKMEDCDWSLKLAHKRWTDRRLRQKMNRLSRRSTFQFRRDLRQGSIYLYVLELSCANMLDNNLNYKNKHTI